MNSLAERVAVAALSMSPERLIDEDSRDQLNELEGAMALAEVDSSDRDEARTKAAV